MSLLKKTYRYSSIAVGTVAGLAVSASTALAYNFQLPEYETQNLNSGVSGNLGTTIGRLASDIIPVILTIVGVLAVLYLIYSGILYITAGGNADRVKAARTGIINAIIGIIVVMAAFFIVRFAVSVGRQVDNTNVSQTVHVLPVI